MVIAVGLISGVSFASAATGVIRFAAVGDPECKDTKLLAEKIKLVNVNRTLLLGDLGYQDSGGKCVRAAFVGTNAKPAVGNHDKTSAVLDVWDISSDIQTYKSGNVRFLSINTEKSAFDQKSRVQNLLNKYKNDATVDWIMPYFHKCMICSNDAHHPPTEVKNFASTFIPMFLDNGKVKLVLQAHNHAYQDCTRDGIKFITVGTGGRPDRGQDEELGNDKNDNCKNNMIGTDGFLVASITSNEIVGMFKDLKNNQYDNTKFEISK